MEINLAAKTIGRVRQTQKAKRFLDRAVLWGGIGLSLGLIALASLNLLINKSNQLLNSKIKSQEKQIQEQAKVESQQVYLSSKLTSFSGLLKTHELHQAVAETIFNLLPAGTSLKGFQIEASGVINLSGSVPNWKLLSQLLLNLRQPTSPLSLKSTKINQINFTADKGVGFDLELTLKL